LVTALLGGAAYQTYGYFAARGHFRSAQAALDRHDWDAAYKHLGAYLRARPDSPDAHRLAARAARRLNLPDDAQSHLDTCRRLEGEETQATKVEQALLRLHRGDLRGTESFLRASVARDDPDAVEILDILSAALIFDYRLPEAHRCLDDLLRRQPDNFDMLVRHAWTAQNQAWNTVAVESLSKALTLRPEADEVRLSLIQNLLILDRYADALAEAERLHDRQPDNPEVVFTLARCLAGEGQKKRAVELLDGLLPQEPDNPSVLGERGWLAMELDRPDEAEGYLRRAQSVSPPDQVLLTRFADCLRLNGKHDEARRYREKAERLREDTQQALRLTKQIREERPDSPDLYHELACLLLRLDKGPDALRFFHKALEKDPRHRPTHESLAAYFTRVGDARQAAFHRRQLGSKQ
jgi:predicted Zn-dependent protease